MKVAEDRNFYVKREATHWLLKKKNTNKSFGINFDEIPYDSSLCCVLGYVKCLFLYENN